MRNIWRRWRNEQNLSGIIILFILYGMGDALFYFFPIAMAVSFVLALLAGLAFGGKKDDTSLQIDMSL